MSDLVRKQLGDASARLHARLIALIEVATTARPALVRVVGDLLCGAYHDHQSALPDPKAALVAAICAVPSDARTSGPLAALIVAVQAGDFADGDAEIRSRRARFVGPVDAGPVALPRPWPVLQPPKPLSERQAAVLAWLVAFHAEHGRSPTGKQIADALQLDPRNVSQTLQQLERKRLIVCGPRPAGGWFPTRTP
jgi:hypothetical protein